MSRADAPDVVLTEEQVAFYHREGYLALPAIAPPQEVAWLREVYDRLFAARAGREEGNQFDLGGADEEGQTAALPQILDPSRYAPELKEGRYRVNALAVARQLLGPEARPQGEHAIFKPARFGAETPWHQDEAYWDPMTEYNALSLWIPLQEATVENGCMWFLPGSHGQEVQSHHSIGHDPRVHGLEMDDAASIVSGRAVACPVPPGGCTIHHNRTMHYAGPNPTDIPRRAYILAFGLPGRPRAEPRRFPWNEMKRTAREQRAREARERAAR